MLRKLLDYPLSLVEKGRPLHFLRPLVLANDNLLFEAPLNAKTAPYIRDAIDIKRWMLLVVLSLTPVILMTIWNTGLQAFVYASGDQKIMQEFMEASISLDSYFAFVSKSNRYLTVIWMGLEIFIPIVLISYIVGGFWEALFACVLKRDMTEGFLVSGILYALILPPTLPYWMIALGVSVGIVFGKEIFGGTGKNYLNPAMTCRLFLFLAFPSWMIGNVWVGTDSSTIDASLERMNRAASLNALDGYTQATPLANFNVSHDIKQIHVDAIATNNLGDGVRSYSTIENQFTQWNEAGHHQAALGSLTQDQLKEFVTSSSGLALAPEHYPDAYHFSSLNYGLGTDNDWGYFLGNKLGSIGETSGFAIILGALFMIYTGVASWRTMVAMGLGAFLTAFVMQSITGPWSPAVFGFPAYKHFLLGGLLFVLVFMATDPVTHPSTSLGKWIFGLFCGILTIIFRILHFSFPDGIMFAILIGNLLSPLIDRYAAFYTRWRKTV